MNTRQAGSAVKNRLPRVYSPRAKYRGGGCNARCRSDEYQKSRLLIGFGAVVDLSAVVRSAAGMRLSPHAPCRSVLTAAPTGGPGDQHRGGFPRRVENLCHCRSGDQRPDVLSVLFSDAHVAAVSVAESLRPILGHLISKSIS